MILACSIASQSIRFDKIRAAALYAWFEPAKNLWNQDPRGRRISYWAHEELDVYAAWVKEERQAG